MFLMKNNISESRIDISFAIWGTIFLAIFLIGCQSQKQNQMPVATSTAFNEAKETMAIMAVIKTKPVVF